MAPDGRNLVLADFSFKPLPNKILRGRSRGASGSLQARTVPATTFGLLQPSLSRAKRDVASFCFSRHFGTLPIRCGKRGSKMIRQVLAATIAMSLGSAPALAQGTASSLSLAPATERLSSGEQL